MTPLIYIPTLPEEIVSKNQQGDCLLTVSEQVSHASSPGGVVVAYLAGNQEAWVQVPVGANPILPSSKMDSYPKKVSVESLIRDPSWQWHQMCVPVKLELSP